MTRHPVAFLAAVTVAAVAAILAALAAVAARHTINPDWCRHDIDNYIAGAFGIVREPAG